MLILKNKTALLLETAIKESFGEGLLSAADIFSMLEYPPDSSMGDLALPCFKLSKSLRRSPVHPEPVISREDKCSSSLD